MNGNHRAAHLMLVAADQRARFVYTEGALIRELHDDIGEFALPPFTINRGTYTFTLARLVLTGAWPFTRLSDAAILRHISDS